MPSPPCPQGRALFGDKLTSGPVALPNGEVRQLRTIDTTYVFPGEEERGSIAAGCFFCVRGVILEPVFECRACAGVGT